MSLKTFIIFSGAFLLLVTKSMAFGINGPYVAAQTGGAYQVGNHKYTNAQTGNGKQHIKGRGHSSGLVLGYLKEINNSKIMLGANVYYNILGVSKKEQMTVNERPEGEVKISHKTSYGVQAMAGQLLNPLAFMYFSLGYERGKFDFNYTNLYYGTKQAEKRTETLGAVVPGVGVLCQVGQKLILGLHYGYAIFSRSNPRRADQGVNGAQLGYTFRSSEHRGQIQFVIPF